MSAAEAAKSGAISMAGEKYGDRVRVVHAGPAVEYCGGTHAVTTGELGLFLIVSEGSIGTGVRRIESVVSMAAEAYALEQQELLAALAESLSAKPAELGVRVERLQSDLRDLNKSVAELKAKSAASGAAGYVEQAQDVNGTRAVLALVPDAGVDGLRALSAAIRQKLGNGVIALAGVADGNVSLLVTASDDAVACGVHAGNLVKLAAPLVGGKGGGQAAQAQGGGKNSAGVDAALEAIRSALAG
jgi:alanyl-tRNA synthetase